MSNISITFPADRTAPAFARRTIAEFIAEHDASRLASDAELLTSEIVTNSVRHAGLDRSDLIGLNLDLTDERMRVSISDGGAGFDPDAPRPRELGGWGLILVARISDRWGVDRNAPNVVWFELDREQDR